MCAAAAAVKQCCFSSKAVLLYCCLTTALLLLYYCFTTALLGCVLAQEGAGDFELEEDAGSSLSYVALHQRRQKHQRLLYHHRVICPHLRRCT
jgi:hypothetical protein